MEITPTALDLSQLFGQTNVQFVIPPYQRRYSWQKKQITQLFEDLNNLKQNETHFLGNIVCLNKPFEASYNTLELVDGQQRMTTFYLILDTLKDRLQEAGEQSEVGQLEIYLSCNDIVSKKKLSKLLLGDLDASDFDTIINCSAETREQELQKVNNTDLVEAYRTIEIYIAKLSDDEVLEFKNKLINKTKIVQLLVSNARDAFKLFETINNRGLSLSPTDIIKNFLLGHASMIDDVTLEKVKKAWTKIIINMDGRNLDEFFRQYLMGKLGRKLSFNNLTEMFKKYYLSHVHHAELLAGFDGLSDEEVGQELSGSKRLSPIKFLLDLEEASEIYSKIINKDFSENINEELLKLEKIRSFTSYTFILNLMQRDIAEKDVVAVLKMIEVFMMRRNVCAYRTAELDDLFSKMVRLEGDMIYKVKDFLTCEDRTPKDSEFEQAIISAEFYGSTLSRAKCMLEEIEYYNTGNTVGKLIRGGAYVHLEHIMPQTITTKKSIQEEGGDWQKYLGPQALELHPKYVYRLGNMTLLEAKPNIVASNNPFNSKKKEYVATKTEFKITQELAKFPEFKFQNIEDRTKKLAKLSVKLWRI